MIFQQSQALTSHFESFWSIVAEKHFKESKLVQTLFTRIMLNLEQSFRRQVSN